MVSFEDIVNRERLNEDRLRYEYAESIRGEDPERAAFIELQLNHRTLSRCKSPFADSVDKTASDILDLDVRSQFERSGGFDDLHATNVYKNKPQKQIEKNGHQKQ